ncbi:Phm7p [Kluyveromyces lactis]|uniref:KLLA0C11187p n=1 Tax=Kluyveromyces lactis (strain ATCC 8585 / CBS 2359 / DSM 70799 / NBRC 1267 / NRRL Y-1140 / WM37) TaxID=284590 RepID=Q6CTP0_KLULA|nr:uncharacterized protein KLLA0_C11187g [Kluyveromyces lactis]CAH01550.1 KLLA0C11187p [Kluyveromyces lactis]|eukprot:XP_452699.1 uncharacterized protein KLLA0_C11187g [Kluyveromyces lactis]
MSDAEGASSSTSAFVTTLIVNGVIATVFVWLFLTLRPKQQRVYQPRSLTDIKTIPESERTEEVPSGYFDWVPYLLTKPHSYLIQHASIDGYLFLRYISIFGGISLIGCFILFPILLPVNATNGYNLEGFELLAFSNVSNKNRFFAHVFLSWIFFGLIIFIIYRELYYYVTLRHSIQTSPLYDGLLSSRSIILTDLQGDFCSEPELNERFLNVSQVFLARDLSTLHELVKERAQLANKYESTLNGVITKSVKKKLKADKKGEKVAEGTTNLDQPQNDLETYIPLKKRPKHRLSKIPILNICLSEKVDTLDYSVKHISELNEKIGTEQESWEDNNTVGSAFIEFKTQYDAQRAYQSIPYLFDKDIYDSALIGYGPDDVIWESTSMNRKTRKVKRLGGNTILTLMIIFWAIPVAVVGCISNINFLTDKVPFLRFIDNMPDVLMGVITGLLPTILLALLMSLVPVFIKKVAMMTGALTRQEIELYCHAWYYAFQVVQVFIVVTLASSASSTVTDIIDEPDSAMTLLAQNLPKASNFYIAYFLLQGLTVPSGALLQVVALILSKVLGRVLDKTPRQKWARYNTLSQPSWGVVYPVLELLVCIFITYSIIAPIILVFSTVALGFFFLAYLYNLTYVMSFSYDLRGRNYPRALFQVFVGLYLAEICLIGLFIMAKTWGPLVLEAVFLAATALAHIYFKRRFIPLFDAVPLSAIRYARGEEGSYYPAKDQGLNEIQVEGKKLAENILSEDRNGVFQETTKQDLQRVNMLPDEYEDSLENDSKSNNGNGTISGSSKQNPSTFVNDSEQFHKTKVPPQIPPPEVHQEERDPNIIVNRADAGQVISDVKGYPINAPEEQLGLPSDLIRPKSIVARCKLFFQPQKYYDFAIVRQTLPYVFNDVIRYDLEYLETAFTEPCVREKEPIIWCARDPMGLSHQQISIASASGVDVRDDFAGYDETGKTTYSNSPPDYEMIAKK